MDREEKKSQFSDGHSKDEGLEDTSDIENELLVGDSESTAKDNKADTSDKRISDDGGDETFEEMTTGDEASTLGIGRKRGGLLEEAEAISDDDLEALIEEDNEPMGKPMLLCAYDSFPI